MNTTPKNYSKELLEGMYITQKLSLSQIAARLNCNLGTVRNYLLRHKIPIRTPSQALTHDLSGQTFGYWIVTDSKDNRGGPKKTIRWKCLCTKCNVHHWVQANSLTSGVSTMCYPCRLKTRRKGHEELTGTQWTKLKDAAESRNIEVLISIEYAWGLFLLQNRKCALSGIELVFGYKMKTTASLDRIDNDKGYIEGNVQWVHKDINRMKWTHTQDDFIKYCELVTNHQRQITESLAA